LLARKAVLPAQNPFFEWMHGGQSLSRKQFIKWHTLSHLRIWQKWGWSCQSCKYWYGGSASGGRG
jgi:hypothetical protein